MTLAEYVAEVEAILDDKLDPSELRHAVHAWWSQATAHERAEALGSAELVG